MNTPGDQHQQLGDVQGLVIRPGDRVIIGLVEEDGEALVEIDAQLRERFPDVEFTIIAGVGAIAAYRERHVIIVDPDAAPGHVPA